MGWDTGAGVRRIERHEFGPHGILGDYRHDAQVTLSLLDHNHVSNGG
jgi:hypothetical protein